MLDLKLYSEHDIRAGLKLWLPVKDYGEIDFMLESIRQEAETKTIARVGDAQLTFSFMDEPDAEA